MTELHLEPHVHLIYFTKLDRAIETVPLAQKSTTEADCILTDARLMVCGRISSIPLPQEERGCFEMAHAEIREVAAGLHDDPSAENSRKPGVTVRGDATGPNSRSLTLFPTSGTQTAADELAAQIERAIAR